MGSCVSKTKAVRAKQGKVAARLPPVGEKEGAQSQSALPPPPAVVVVEEEVKEVVLSETPVPRPPRPPPPEEEPEPVKWRQQDQRHPGPGQEAEDEAASSETTCSASDSASAAKEVARLQKAGGGERREVEKRAPDAPEKGRTAEREERDSERGESKRAKGKGGGGAGRARSPSPSSAHRRQQQPQSPAQQPRREHPAVVSGIGCRSGRFSPSAARRAAESAAVRRTHSAREADMALPSSKRSLARRERDPGERSWRRSDSPTGRREPASPSAAIHRPGTTSPMRKAAAASVAKEYGHGHGTPERGSRPPRARDGADDQPGPAWAGGGAEVGALGGEQQIKRLAAEEGAALGQNPSVAMECFIFL